MFLLTFQSKGAQPINTWLIKMPKWCLNEIIPGMYASLGEFGLGTVSCPVHNWSCKHPWSTLWHMSAELMRVVTYNPQKHDSQKKVALYLSGDLQSCGWVEFKSCVNRLMLEPICSSLDTSRKHWIQHTCADMFTSSAVVKTCSEVETKCAQSWNFPCESTRVEPQAS